MSINVSKPEHINKIIERVSEQNPEFVTDEISDGFHTFGSLYHQRAILFATIVNSYPERSWKSWKHSDGEGCFGENKDWFIVGIDTPKGSYTYHYPRKYWKMFRCKAIRFGKPWDGHTEKDVTRLLSLTQNV